MENWKIDNVTPIFKKRSRFLETETKNTKCIEEEVLQRKNQHGFCKGKSHLTNLFEFFERVRKGDLVDIIYLDFLKAKVPH